MEDGKKMINVLYEDNHLLVVEKPINVLVQADNTKDLDLLTMCKNYLKEKYHKPGNVYLGLVHRLDRVVGGVMVFAKTSKAAARLSEQVRNHEFKKTYYAVVCGKLTGSGTLKDYLLKDEKTNTSYVSKEGKLSILNYEVISCINNLSLVKIDLETGRHHQIRVQFKNFGYPLYGDHRYNKNYQKGEQIALFAKKLSFFHPITKEVMTFSLPLPNRYPYTLFK
jgi:23S rRNA pseudouridine1911/1915/1917 synthase